MSRPKLRASAHLALAGILLLFGGARAQTLAPTAFSAPVPVGTISSPHTFTLPVNVAGSVTGITLAGSDEFHMVPGGSCAAGHAYAAGDTCTVNLVFAPSAPGAANAVATIRSAGNVMLGFARVRGVGLGSMAAFTPGLVETIALQSPPAHGFSSIAAAGNGAAYLTDAFTGQVLRFDATTGNVSAVATASPGSDPVLATAADADGTLFLARASGMILRLDAATGALTSVPLPTAGNSAARPTAMAVDRTGRLLLALGSSVSRLEHGAWTAIAGGAPCPDPASPCGDGGDAAHATFNTIRAMAVENNGNLLLADAAEARLRRIDATTGLVSTVAGTGTPCRHDTCGDNGPALSAALGTLSTIAVDPLGNIYLAEQGAGLRRIDAVSNTLTSVLPGSQTRFRAGDVQLAALRDGSILLLAAADPANMARFHATAAALTFATTAVGETSTDSVQTVTLSNLGNAPLSMATPLAGTNPSTTADFPLGSTQTCPQLSTGSASQALAPGTSCSLQVKFTPTSAGTVTGKVVLSEASAAAPVAHSIAVQGAGTPAPTTQANIAFTSLPPSLVYGQPVTLLVTAFAPSGSVPAPTGTVTFTEGSTTIAAGVALSGGFASTTITLPSSGSHTYAVAYSGDSNYAPSSQNSTTSVMVNRAASVFTISIATFQYGQSIRPAFVLSGQYSGTGIALPTGRVTYTLLDRDGNVVSNALANAASRVNSIDENAPLGVLHAGTYTFRLSYPGDANFLPLQRDYTLNVLKASQRILFPIIYSPVTYGIPPIPLSAAAVTGADDTNTELHVTFSVVSGPATIVDNHLVINGVGTIIVAADQAGNSDYLAAPRVTQTVESVRPVARLAWNTPSPIVTGTPLGAQQLNAFASDPNGQSLLGTFTYTPAAGTVLPVGNTTLNVTFVPADTEHYGNVTLTASVVLTVRDLVTPVITFPGGTVAAGANIAAVLNATATNNGAAVPGTFVYTTGGTTLRAGVALPVGTYTVLATFTAADPNNARNGSATGTITVTKGNAAIALTSSASPVLLNSPFTLTATVTGAANVPTGSVQFSAGSTVLGSSPLGASGTASFTLSTLPAGSQSITATYSGDGNYNDASATLTEVVADFTLALTANAPGKQAVLPGKVATYQFTVAPTVSSTLVSDVGFSVSGLPTGATYTLTPSTVAGGSGSTAVALAVTAPLTLKSSVGPSPWHGRSAVVTAALLLLPFASVLRRGSHRLRRAGVLAVVLAASAVLFGSSGCGTGVGYFDQAQVNSTITLTATSGSLSHAASVTLEIQ